MSNITAIIPTYNRSRVLKRAIESALNQNVPPAKLIVVDDGSTDDTAELCGAYKKLLQYVRQENGGASASRNAGVQLTSTQWVAFLDSDDYWTPGHLDRISRAIAHTSGQARFYFADMEFPEREGGGTLWQKIAFSWKGDFLLNSDATSWMLMARQPTMLQSTVFSKEALQSVGGLRTTYRLMHDSDLFCRLGIGAAACAVAGVGCIQTDDDTATRLTGMISTNSPSYWNEQSNIWGSVLKSFPGLNPIHRRIVRNNLAASYWRLCRLHGRGQRVASAHFLLKAALTDPGFVGWSVLKGSSEGYDRSIRAAAADLIQKSFTNDQGLT
jgi:glycosyltransferase involved in cell wall biosynthesis